MIKFYDISMPLSNNMPVWPGDPSVKFIKTEVMLNNRLTFVTELNLSTHSATHIDLPGHFNKEHPLTIDSILLENVIGNCLVVSPPFTERKFKEYFKKYNCDAKRILLKIYNNDSLEELYKQDKEVINETVISFLIDNGLRLIGVDGPAPESTKAVNFPIHQKLFNHNVLILENLNLLHIDDGKYELICLPLLLQGVNDGAPCRAILKRII